MPRYNVTGKVWVTVTVEADSVEDAKWAAEQVALSVGPTETAKADFGDFDVQWVEEDE